MVKLGFISGDGVGSELVSQGVHLLNTLKDYLGLSLEPVIISLSENRISINRPEFLESFVRELKKDYRALIFGAIGGRFSGRGGDIGQFYRNLKHRLELGVFFQRCNSRLIPANVVANRDTPSTVLIRDNLETELSRATTLNVSGVELEHRLQLYSVSRAEKIVRYALEYCEKYEIKNLYLVDDNQWDSGYESLYRRTFRRVLKESKEGVSGTYFRLNAFVVELLRKPEQFRVILASPQSGLILAYLLVYLQGGWGMSAFAALNPGSFAVFAPMHGALKSLEKRNLVNPFAIFHALSLALSYLKEYQAARLIEEGIRKAILDKWVTYDIGGSLGTSEVTDFVCNFITRSIDSKK